jgi:hypothetical protein
MNGSWQEIVVTAAVLAALAWLVIDRIRRRKSKCNSCALADSLRRKD